MANDSASILSAVSTSDVLIDATPGCICIHFRLIAQAISTTTAASKTHQYGFMSRTPGKNGLV
jgi:hypothetical protein